MPTMHGRIILGAIALWLALETSGGAAPLDLNDPTPRWVEIRFEVSPSDQPGSMNHRWGVFRRAWLSPGESDQHIEIRVPQVDVEAQLRSTGTDAVGGSFSDFVWQLDPRNGQVLEAVLSGRVRQRISLGPFHRSMEVAIDVEMSTSRRAGFMSSRGTLGVQTQTWCDPSGARARCQEVTAVPFDRKRGYVNAVGILRASAGLIEVHAFSPLGEVEFRERVSEPLQTIAAEGASGDAICSSGLQDPCEPDSDEDS